MYNNTTYIAIGHPGGDTKMVNVDYDRAYVNSNGEEFGLYFDEGISEEGFSGSPIFNDEAKVVGWLCAASDSADCLYVGTEDSKNKTTCGRLDNLHFYLSSYIDPTYYGEASSDLPSQPQPTAHCSDCIQNYDETGIDCGGEDCYPCGMRDVVALKTLKDIAGPVKSRYDLIADPDPNTSLTLKGGNYSFEAGMNIFLNGGFEVAKGAVFYASIDNELMSEADRGCQDGCVQILDSPFSPNGDGINDYWGFGQAFITKYSLTIYNNWGQVIFSSTNQPIFENGWNLAWDGSGAPSGLTAYRSVLTYTDCKGITKNKGFNINVGGMKSAEINEDIIIKNNNQSLESSIPKIKVYPNPSFNKVSIDYSGNEFPVKYKLTDMNGKLIIEGETDSQTEILNLNGFASGAYIINVKAGECNLVQKLIKE
jgi:gliding motility-associated-like protein